jgi:hypothetical protein
MRLQASHNVVESLENRVFLSASPFTINTVNAAEGLRLEIAGTDGNDRIIVSAATGGLQVSDGADWSEVFQGTFAKIIVHAGLGNDYVEIAPTLTVPAIMYDGRYG